MRVPEPFRRAAAASTSLSTFALLFLVSLIGWPDAGHAVAILRGDIVAITSTNQGIGPGTGSIVHIDPVTGAQSEIAAGGYIDVGLTHDGRIFAITGSELVEVQPVDGDVRIVRDLTDLGSATGLAVGPTGALFVAYEDLATRLSGIEAIDAGSGVGSSVSSLGSFGRVADLEFISGGNLAALAESPGGDHGELALRIVDPITGVSAAPGISIIQGTAHGGALGVSPTGDLIAAVAMGHQGTSALALVVATDEIVSLNVPLFSGADRTCLFEEPDCGDDLTRSDVAYDESGQLLLSVNSRPGSAPWTSRLFRLEADGSSQIVSEGSFSELQVAVPEPSTAYLLVAGVLGLAFWRRAARTRASLLRLTRRVADG